MRCREPSHRAAVASVAPRGLGLWVARRFLALGKMKHYAALLVWFALLAGCARQPSPQLPSGIQLPPNFHPDTGRRIHEFGRPATGDADVLLLGDTGFRAVVCASHYTHT